MCPREGPVRRAKVCVKSKVILVAKNQITPAHLPQGLFLTKIQALQKGFIISVTVLPNEKKSETFR